MTKKLTYLQAVDVNITRKYPVSTRDRVLIWLASLNEHQNHWKQLSDTEIEQLANALANLIDEQSAGIKSHQRPEKDNPGSAGLRV